MEQIINYFNKIMINKEPINNKNVIIYCRTSTPQQSNVAQEAACIDYCKKNNLNIIKIVHETGSAFKSINTKLNEIINNESDIILLIYNADRISRNIDNCNIILNKLEENNIILKSVTENINIETLYGKHEFRVLISNAQLESERLGVRIKNTIEYKKKNNMFCGGTIKYGYKKSNNQITWDSNEQSVITFIIKNLNKKKCSKEITKELFNILMKFNKPNEFYIDAEFINTKTKAVYDEDEKIKISCLMLSNLLNEYEILKRNIKWTPNAIKYIYTKMK